MLASCTDETILGTTMLACTRCEKELVVRLKQICWHSGRYWKRNIVILFIVFVRLGDGEYKGGMEGKE